MTERERVWRLAGVNVLVGAFGMGVVVLFNWLLRGFLDDEAGFVAAAGLLYGHVIFLASLMAMGPWSRKRKYSILGGLYVLVVLVENSVFWATLPDRPSFDVFLCLIASTLPLLIVLQLPIGPSFKWWRIGQIETGVAAAADYKTFSIRDLFVWTTIVAFLLAAGRIVGGLLPENFQSMNLYLVRLSLVFGTLVLFTLLLAWPLIWALWSQHWKTKILISAAIAIIAWIAEVVVLETWDGSPRVLTPYMLLLFSLMNGATYLSLLVHAVVVRRFGYRLVV